MQTDTAQYFNGWQAKPYHIIVELKGKQIVFYDVETDDPNAVTVFLRDCTISVTAQTMYVFLDKKRNEYITIPTNHSLYEAIKRGVEENQKGWFNALIKQKWYSLLAILVSVVIILYLIATYVLPIVVIKCISTEQEVAFGKGMYRSIVNEEKIDSNVSRLMNSFAKQLHLSDRYNIHITVIKSKTINAFALPGGNIVVYSGIIKAIKSSDELVALLSHEATHINKRHSLKSVFSNMGSSVIISVLTQGSSNVFFENVNVLNRLSYSRGLEKEADTEGMYLMLQNKVNVSGMKKLMEELQKQNAGMPSVLSFMSTHPLTEDRIKNADLFMQEHTGKFQVNDTLQNIWEQMVMETQGFKKH